MRTTLIVMLALASSACINWQGGYDYSARKECGAVVNADERRACLDAVEHNASSRRADRRAE
jgi:hypothetical protein